MTKKLSTQSSLCPESCTDSLRSANLKNKSNQGLYNHAFMNAPTYTSSKLLVIVILVEDCENLLEARTKMPKRICLVSCLP